MKLARAICSLSVLVLSGSSPWLRAQANVAENESAVLYVDARSGSDANAGSSSAPLKTIQAAVNKANTNNQKSIGTKIIVNAGTYREAVSINPVSGQTSAPLTVEAANDGTAVIAGSDLLTGWSTDAQYAGAYVSNWTPAQSTCALPSGWPAVQAIALHTEMLFVNGIQMTQVLAYADLQPGTFFVNPGDGTVHLWPVEGINPSNAIVEISTRAKTMSVYGRSNIVLRGLVFEHAASCINASGATVSSSTNVLVDSVHANWNNFGGIGVFSSSNITVQNSIANYNGGVGIQSSKDQSALYANNETDYNNWRGAQAAFYNWASGGAKFFQMRKTQVAGHLSYNNQAQGLWFDTDNQYITIDGATLSGNYDAALQLERNKGPITLANSRMCSSGVGLNVLTTEGLTVKNNVLYNNGATNKYQAQIYLAGTAGGINITDWQTGQTYDLVTTGVVLSGNEFIDSAAGQYVFGTYLGGTDWTEFASTLKSDGNTWYDPATSNAFHIVNGKNVNLAGWQSATGADYNSTWQTPSTAPASACAAPSPAYADFNVSVDNGAYTMTSGVATATVRVNSFNYGPVTLSMSGLPSGVGATFSAPALTRGFSTLTFTASSTTKTQTVPVTLWAVSGDRVHSVTFNLSVNANSSVIGTSTSLTASSSSIAEGSAVTMTASVAALSGTSTPTGTVTFYDEGATIGTASLSGGKAVLTSSTLGAGAHTISASYGGAGGFNASTSNDVSITVKSASVSTTTTLTSSAAAVTENDTVKLTATVKQASGATTPPGSVTFYNGTSALGAATVSSGIATLSTSTLAVGTDAITAVYSGASGFNASTSNAVSITVKSASVSTTTTLISSALAVIENTTVNLTATVKQASGTTTPSGSVTFYNGTSTLGVATLSSGIATLSTSAFAVGTDAITAVYSGAGGFNASTSNAVSITVSSAVVSTSTVLSSTSSAIAQNSTVTLTATVKQASGTTTPSGTVTFYNGSAPIGSASLSSGTATFATKSLPAGTDSVYASYSGAVNFKASTSNILTITVNPAAPAIVKTSTSLASSTPSINQNSPVTLIAVVKPASGSTLPGGSVAFTSGSGILGTAQLSGGTATLTTSALPVGVDTVAASYAGSSAFASSVSAPVSITVNAVAVNTTTSLSASSSAIAEKSSVTFTAIVRQASGSSVPNGTLTFYDGTKSIGSAVLASGSASINTSSLTVGTHSISAGYAGSAGFKASTSPLVSVKVSAPSQPATTRVSTTTTISSSTAQADQGFTISLAALVAAPTGSPTGLVDFSIGPRKIGSASLANGKAYLNTSALPVGTNAITATYAGDAGHLASSSTAISIRIVGPDFTIQATPETIAATQGENVNLNLLITPQNGFSQTPILTCEGLPQGSSCSFGTPAKQSDGTLLVGVTIHTAVETASEKSTPSPLFPALSLIPLMLWISPRRSRSIVKASCSLVLVLMLGWMTIGCGGRPTTSSSHPAPTSESISITMTAKTSSGLSHATSVKLILN